MAAPDQRQRLQRYVDDLTAQYWKKASDNRYHEIRSGGAMHTLDDLCGDLAHAWDAQRWFQVTSACALCAELLTASVTGGIFNEKVPHLRRGGNNAAVQFAEVLYSLRNVCFHPAHLNPHESREGNPHVRVLATLLKYRGEHEVAQGLQRDHGQVRSRKLAEVAVLQLDGYGKELAITRPALWKG